MAKASLTIAIGGEYNGKAIDKAAKALRDLNTEAARHAGGMTESFTKAGDSLVNLGTDMERTGAKIQSVGASITKATAPIAAVGAAAVKMASDYENAVAKVYTIMDKGVMSTDDMAKSILDLSTKTGKGANELADATYQALSASVATEKVAGFVEEAVKLSKAGFTETATAVDTLTTVINAYGYSAEDAAMISDRLVQTQNKGKTTVDELASSMGNVIPTASAYNVSLDNLCSAYVIMTKQGINTANATTAINGMLTELADSGSDVAKILQEKTGKSFGQLMSDGMDLGEVIQILSESVDGDSEAFANLWGNVRASKGALAIANAGASEFTSTMGDMANSTGLCEKALDDLATPAAKANKAINAVKNTGILLGEEIIGAAVPSLEKLSSMAQDLYKWFSELDDGTKQNIVRLGALVVAAGPVITIFGKMYSGVGSLIKGLGTGMQSIGAFSAAMKATEVEMRTAGATSVGLGTKMMGAAEKTGLLTKATGLLKGSLAMLGVGAAIAVVGILIDKYREWKEHTDKVEKATRGMEDAIGSAKLAYDAYTPSVEGATRALENNAISADEALDSQAELADKMNATWKDIGTNAAMVDHYAQTIAELGSKGDLTKEDIVRLQSAIDGFNQLTGSSIEITNEMTGELNTSKDAILGVAEAYKEEARAAAAREMLVEVNKQILQDEMALRQAKEELSTAEENYQQALRDYPDTAWVYGQAVTDAERKVNEMDGALNSARKSEQDLVDLLSASPTHFKTMEAALESCGVGIEDLGNVTDEQLAAMQANFDGTLGSIYKTCVEQGMNIPEGLSRGIESTADAPKRSMSSMISDLVAKTKSDLESHSPSRVMQRIGEDIDIGLGNGIDGKRDKPTSSMEQVASAMKKAVEGLPDYARRIGDDSGSGMYSGLHAWLGNVSTAAQGLSRSASDGIGGTPSTFSAAGSSAASSFASVIGSSSAYWAGSNLAYTAQSGLGSVSSYNAGYNFSAGFANGMYGVNIWGYAYSIGVSALNAIKYALGIASPSKETARVGEWFGEGAVMGMQRTEKAVSDEAGRLSDLMQLAPEPYGMYGPQSRTAASNGQSNMAPSTVTMNVTVNVNASNANEGAATGKSLADALYEELSRKMGSSLWPVSYSAA
ncbi:MAG: phage tail tape measure protein [Eggerthellaceae bacterium]|nr:phage tail tape measure protein [Kiritimatiellia bacterium]MBR0403777.1 phage tail tape measure protein [Eggerthellaceae bacterium]